MNVDPSLTLMKITSLIQCTPTITLIFFNNKENFQNSRKKDKSL